MNLDPNSWRNITWLASYPKSGNTWIRCFLDAYFFEKLDINAIVSSTVDDYLNHIGLTRKQQEDLQNIAESVRLVYKPQILYSIVEKYKKANPQIPLLVKTHAAIINSGGILTIPAMFTKRILYIVRNPIDIAPSFASHYGLSMDETIDIMVNDNVSIGGDYIERLPTPILSWKSNVASYINIQNESGVKIVKYEDIKADPKEQFKNILEFIGIAPEQERLENAINLTKLNNLKRQEKEKGFIEKAKKEKSSFFGGKRGKITTNQKRKLIGHFRDLMVALGYINNAS